MLLLRSLPVYRPPLNQNHSSQRPGMMTETNRYQSLSECKGIKLCSEDNERAMHERMVYVLTRYR